MPVSIIGDTEDISRRVSQPNLSRHSIFEDTTTGADGICRKARIAGAVTHSPKGICRKRIRGPKGNQILPAGVIIMSSGGDSYVA